MTSNPPQEAYVWHWLPGEVEPVVAGRLVRQGDLLMFHYGQSYLSQAFAVPLYLPELPLQSGVLPLLNGLSMPGCLRDASPDAWGRRVIMNRELGGAARGADTAHLDELTYLLASGSDRIGALDFQVSATDYRPRAYKAATLDELLTSAERVEQGVALSAELDQALCHGSSIGGARPKALLDDTDTKWIAKFASSGDLYSVVKAEFMAMRLAAHVGLDVAPVKWVRAMGKDVLLIERFDRQRVAAGWCRRSVVSALTIMGLDDMTARYASYTHLAEIIRHRFTRPKETLQELFRRLVFNILVGNTDDHARNHAAFWDGEQLTLTPAYDLCPQPRTGQEASQAMAISETTNLSQLANCVAVASHFMLSESEAREECQRQVEVIRAQWSAVCDAVELSEVDRTYFWHRQFLNPFALQRF